MSNGVFNFNFLALLLSEILGGSQIYTTPPGRPLAENFFFTQSEYFTISNCVFNFNILALVVSEILGGSQIYVRGPSAPCTPPSGKIFAPETSTLLCLMASPTLNRQPYEGRLPLTSWWRKSSNMTVGQSSLIYLAHHCYD